MIQGMQEAYGILGVPMYASKDQIKKAYRSLCKEYHPDKNQNPYAIQRYLEIQKAYRFLVETEALQIKNNFGEFCRTNKKGKIIGGRSPYYRHEEIVKKAEQAEKKRKEKLEELKKQEERKRQLEKRMQYRKLPSEIEAEKMKKIEMEREAERIAQIIKKLIELNQ